MVTSFYKDRGRSVAHVVSGWPPTAEVRFLSTSVNMGIMVDKVALRQVFLRMLQYNLVRIILIVSHIHI